MVCIILSSYFAGFGNLMKKKTNNKYIKNVIPAINDQGNYYY